MIATQRNEKIDVTRDGGAPDSDGVWLAAWASHLSNVPAAIKWKKGVDVVVRNRITSRRFAEINVAILDITVKDRIQFDSELYNIVSAIKSANRFMLIEMERNTEEALV